MAAEKRSQSGSQSIVDQDAAITAYLDGLLRDPEQGEAPAQSRPRKTPGLKVIGPELDDATVPDGETDATSADDAPTALAIESGDDELAARLDESDETRVDESPEVNEPPVGSTDGDDMPDAASPEAAESERAEAGASDTPAVSESQTDAGRAEEDMAASVGASDDESASVIAAETNEASPWAWLRVGGMTLAIPAEAVVSRHADAALDPVPGAPSQVAGALSVDGRPRLILSLAAVTGARPRGDAREVLLLGAGGLWGVVGEPTEPPEAFDPDAVEWRSESQKAERRGWLGGTNPSAGVALLDVAGLRAALKGSR